MQKDRKEGWKERETPCWERETPCNVSPTSFPYPQDSVMEMGPGSCAGEQPYPSQTPKQRTEWALVQSHLPHETGPIQCQGCR